MPEDLRLDTRRQENHKLPIRKNSAFRISTEYVHFSWQLLFDIPRETWKRICSFLQIFQDSDSHNL